jgi:hypothetical protein
MLELNFLQSEVDPCVFLRVSEDGQKSIVSIFVDDLIISAKEEEAKKVKEMLMNEFKMRDLGYLSWILGIKVERKETKIELSQKAYINTILEKFRMNDSKPTLTPFPFKWENDLSDANEPFENIQLFQQIVGSLIYLSNKTRPDISCSVGMLARKMSNPTKHDYNLSKRVMRYLNGTKELKLTYDKKTTIAGYSDASYAEDKIDRKSTSGYVFMMNGGAISWRSGKQKIVTLSSMESEYVALTDAAKEGLFLKQLINEQQPNRINQPIIIYEDNQSSIKTAQNRIHNNRSKHIDVRHHFIREQVEMKNINVEYIPTTDQIADIFTKALGATLHVKHTRNLGLM